MNKEFSPKGKSLISHENGILSITLVDENDLSEAVVTIKIDHIALFKYSQKVETGDNVLELYTKGSSVRFLCFDEIEDLHYIRDELKDYFDEVEGCVDYVHNYSQGGGEKIYVLINNAHMSMHKRKVYETKTSFVFFIDALSNKSKSNTFSVIESKTVDVGSEEDEAITQLLY